jgi:hypothetical protein
VLTADTTVTWSLSPVPTRAASPYQGLADADPKGIMLAGLDSNQRR